MTGLPTSFTELFSVHDSLLPIVAHQFVSSGAFLDYAQPRYIFLSPSAGLYTLADPMPGCHNTPLRNCLKTQI